MEFSKEPQFQQSLPAQLSPPPPEQFRKRRSSLIRQFLRQKSLGNIKLDSSSGFGNGNSSQNFQRKDSESTINLWPLVIEEQCPSLQNYESEDLRASKSNNLNQNSSFKFGWINGVYIRTVLNIWGVMLFLRMGWMTGNAGIVVSLGIIAASTLVTICTTLSMSAICTNGEVGTGGIYYMISRSLGVEAGSITGIIFSFANAVLVSLNLVGAAETTVEIGQMFDFMMIDKLNDTRIYALILLVIVAIIPLIGMDWEAKAMFVLLIILVGALINYLIGSLIPPTNLQISEGNLGWNHHVIEVNLWPKFQQAGFSEVFSVFFPSVIGIFAGASMSGDLLDPNAAIPKGTFLAIFTTSSVYALLVVFLGFTVLPYASGNYTEMVNFPHFNNLSCFPNSCDYGLVNDYQTMTMSSLYGPVIYAGIYAATISSALGSYVCSPRIFQAFCEDEIFPRINYFAKGFGSNNDPRRGYILTFLIALIFILIGELNSIAPIISNFFMASFCLVNVTCFHASFVGTPSFRPTFKYYNKWVSLLTGMVCIGTMFFLDWISALATIIIMAIIYAYVSKKSPDFAWGTSSRGHVYNNALFSALKLSQTKDHVKNFRPSILLLIRNPSENVRLIDFTNQITKNRSLLMIGQIINYSIPSNTREKIIDTQYEWLAQKRIKAFYSLLEAPSLAMGGKTMLQISGLGKKLSPNIIMLGYKSSWRQCSSEDLLDYYNVILISLEMSVGICILRLRENLDLFAPHAYQNYASSFVEEKDSVPPEPSDSLGEKPLEGISEKEETVIEESNGSNDSNNDNSLKKKLNFEKVQEVVADEETEDEGTESVLKQRVSIRVDKLNSLSQQSPQKIFTAIEIENIKKLIPADIIKATNQFLDKQKPGPIDIWWLSEDGGLSILIPYLLQTRYQWSGCFVRVFCLTKTLETIESMQQSITEILNRLRIPYSKVFVYAEDDLKVSTIEKKKFHSIMKDFLIDNHHHHGHEADYRDTIQKQVKVTEKILKKFDKVTDKYLKIRSLVQQQSKTSNLIVMTLPMPHREIASSLFMAWLEVITDEMPPFLFVRGQNNVISF